MRALFILSLICLSGGSFAKQVDFTGFNKTLNQNLDTVVEHNPQMYETKEIKRKGSRTPASVEMDPLEVKEQTPSFDKLGVGSSL